MSPLLLISFDNFARRKTSHHIKVKKRNSIDLKSAALICQNEIYNRERLLSRGIDWMEMLLNFEHWWIYHPEWLPVTSTRIMKTQNALSPAARLESSNQKLLSQNSQSSSVLLNLWEEKCWNIFETKGILVFDQLWQNFDCMIWFVIKKYVSARVNLKEALSKNFISIIRIRLLSKWGGNCVQGWLFPLQCSTFVYVRREHQCASVSWAVMTFKVNVNIFFLATQVL